MNKVEALIAWCCCTLCGVGRWSKGSARYEGTGLPKLSSWDRGGFAAVALAWHRRNFAIGRCARVEAKEENALMTHGRSVVVARRTSREVRPETRKQ